MGPVDVQTTKPRTARSVGKADVVTPTSSVHSRSRRPPREPDGGGRRPSKTPRAMRTLERALEGSGIPCEFVLPSGESLQFGDETPDFRLVVRSWRALRRGLDEFALGRAYVEGDVDVEGDLQAALRMRAQLRNAVSSTPLIKFWLSMLGRIPVRLNRRWIARHYQYGDDFYLPFLDRRYRLYSHGLFTSDHESLEDGCERKLQTMFEALALRPGMRLLDIGCGWGSATQFCGERGVHVTSLTISPDSHDFTRRLIRDRELDGCAVHLEDFLDHRPSEPYDAVTILGVIEHIPYYRRFCRQLWNCLRPGGMFYLDASATVQKDDVSRFTRHYIYPGTHSFLAVQDIIQELLFHGMELVSVEQDTHDYELTMRGWAERFDANRTAVLEGWGEEVYRAFRLYLWGGTHAFQTNALQAYHLVARRRADRGPRPGVMTRTRQFLKTI
jgi:cyclopropane fatty-acyl-phospholipid synthase-like methyltransferase